MSSIADLQSLSKTSPVAESAAKTQFQLLLVAEDWVREQLRSLIADRLPTWGLIEAEGVERARFTLQLDPCDMLVVDAKAARAAGTLEWFESVQPMPITFLKDDDTHFFCSAVEHGATHWLPRALALNNPGLLATVLSRAAGEGELRRRLRTADLALVDSRRQVGRLVNRLWETIHSESGGNWFTQRHMLERLAEEVERVKRHGGALSVVLGELLPSTGDDATAADELATWAAAGVSRWKRRSDVAGQYGPHGFMLVLPRSSETAGVGCCERLRALLEQPASPLRGPIRACFGVGAVDAAETVEKTTITKLLRQAEDRLATAKAER